MFLIYLFHLMHSCQWASDLLWTSNVNSGLHIDVHWTSKGLQLVFSTFTAGFTMFALFFSIFFYHFEHIILENKFCCQVVLEALFVSFQCFFFSLLCQCVCIRYGSRLYHMYHVLHCFKEKSCGLIAPKENI